MKLEERCFCDASFTVEYAAVERARHELSAWRNWHDKRCPRRRLGETHSALASNIERSIPLGFSQDGGPWEPEETK